MAYQNRLWNNYKSQGERRIGAYLKDQGIDFTYERPVGVVDDGKTKLWHPDFYLNDYHIIIEYLGMNGNAHNAKLNDYKRHVYRANKYDLIEIYPQDFERNWQEKISRGIYDTLEGRIRDYISKFRHDPKPARRGRPCRQMSFGFYP
jgi:hypothetical protein